MITKYGKVLIGDGDPLVTNFHFDGEGKMSAHDHYIEALEWAIEQCQKKIQAIRDDKRTLAPERLPRV